MQNKFFKFFSMVCLLAIILFMISFSPIFTVKEISIIGNSIINNEEIKTILKYENKNIFSITKGQTLKLLKNNTFVKDVRLAKNYPDSITIEIKERKPAGYVKYTSDRFLYIDDEGFVLDTVDEIKAKLPIITGLDFDSFTEGQALNVSNNKIFFMIVNLTNLLNRYELSNNAVKIDLNDIEDIHVYIYNIDYLFGSYEDADKKIQIIKKSLDKIPNYTEVKAIVNLQTGIVQLIL